MLLKLFDLKGKLNILRRNFTTILKLTVTIVFLWIISREINISGLVNVLTDINLIWLAIAFSVFASIRFLMTLRWKIILNEYGVKVKFIEVLRIIFLSLPAGFVTPGGVGMDLVRGYEISKYAGYESAAGSILLDRIIGVASMFFVAMLAVLFLPDFKQIEVIRLILVICNISIVIGGIGILYLAKSIDINLVQKSNNRLNRVLLKIVNALSDTKKIKNIIFPIVILSITVQIVRCALFYLIYLALGLSISFIYFLAFVPMVFVLIFLPVSLGGLGVREASLMYFFSQVGVSGELSVSAGLIAHLFHLLILIPGLIMYINIHKSNKLDE